MAGRWQQEELQVVKGERWQCSGVCAQSRGKVGNKGVGAGQAKGGGGGPGGSPSHTSPHCHPTNSWEQIQNPGKGKKTCTKSAVKV